MGNGWGRRAVIAVAFGLSGPVTVGCSSTATSTPSGDASATSSTTSTAPRTSTAPASTTVPSTSSTTSPPQPPPSTSSVTTTVAVPVGIDRCPQTGQSIWEVRAASDIEPPPLPAGWTTEVIGRSVQGRDLVVHARPVAEPRHTVLVVGAVHGNEPVSPPTVRALVDADIAPDVELWLLPELNPDGVAAGTRCNANGVDLNRNFPWAWMPEDGGPGPLSEPESAAAVALVDRIEPDLVVWVHQPYGYVSSIATTDDRFEEAWAAGSGTRVRPDVTQHGGGESWTALEAGLPSMLIEIDTWLATPEQVDAHRAGFEAAVRALG